MCQLFENKEKKQVVHCWYQDSLHVSFSYKAIVQIFEHSIKKLELTISREVRYHFMKKVTGCEIQDISTSMSTVLKVKHEYLRSRAYKCLSLSSSSSSFPVTVIQLWALSRYSCLYLGSCIQEFSE